MYVFGRDDFPSIATADPDSDRVCEDRDFCFGEDTTGDVDLDGICGDLDICTGMIGLGGSHVMEIETLQEEK